ncbi:MAG: V-type ATP synthase subunit D [Sphaerochaetaceae bacterium]|nr:V-type ATP synthase subunit D [Sphaerochaetaceae bacterium]
MDTSIAPTRSNLLKLKESLEFATLGHDLLDQKRTILVSELLRLVDQAVNYQDRMDAAMDKARKVLMRTVLEQGRLKTAQLSSAVNIQSDFELSERKVMGVRLPQVQTSFSGQGPFFSPEGTSILVENAIEAFREALELMGHLAELKVSIMRLAREVKKTVRKVNSLEKIVIPDQKQTLAYTSDRIEEAERENYILLKAVKKSLSEKRGGQ